MSLHFTIFKLYFSILHYMKELLLTTDFIIKPLFSREHIGFCCHPLNMPKMGCYS